MKTRIAPFAALAATIAIALASNGALTFSTHQVSNDGARLYRWEPSTTVGSTWITSWDELGGVVNGYVAAWNGSWVPTQITFPTNNGVEDLFLAYDYARSRYVVVGIDGIQPQAQSNIWYAYSTDSTGTHWNAPTKVMSNGQGNWDYPSVAVDPSGRVVVGAVKYSADFFTDFGYWTVVSTNGVTFSSTPVLVGDTNVSGGSRARLIATSANQFYLFSHTFRQNPFSPVSVKKYSSSNGTTWSTTGTTLMTYGAPLMIAPSANYCGNGVCGSIYYSSFVSAKGYSNGLWTVAFPVNRNGFNNVIMCTSNRACFYANGAADDQFLAGTSVSGDGGYWVSWYTYSTLNTRSVPLYRQTILFPASAAAVGVTTQYNINPTYWIPDTPTSSRCGQVTCFEAGDWVEIGSNPFAAASSPFVRQDTGFPFTDLAQDFITDPPAPIPGNFVPNVIPVPVGADISTEAAPVAEPAGFQVRLDSLSSKRLPVPAP
jgi:hypothetical protein